MAAERSPGGFGSKLRDARERRGLTLRQIANTTKISISALEALERNDISRLPGGIFSRAFVRSYAVEVGLDPEATIQEFVAQFPHDSVTAGHQHSAAPEADSLESDRRMAKAFLQLAGVSVPIVGALLYFGLGMRRVPPQPVEPQSVTVPGAEAAPAAALPPAVTTPAPAPPTPAAVTPPAAVVDPPADEALTIGLLARRRCYVS